MALERFLLKRATSPSPESISWSHSQPITSLLFASRSMSSNKTSSLSPSMIGCLVAIGILALLSAVGMGFAIHVQYCRRSDCATCSVIMCLARPRGSRLAPGPPLQQTQQHAYTETPRDGLFLFRPFIESRRMSFRRSLPSPTPPPTRDICRPQSTEKEIQNPVTSTRGPASPSVVSGGCISALGVCGILPLRSPPKDSPIPSEGKVTHSHRTSDCRSNLSEDISIITLPSFVEHEHHDSTSAAVLSPPNPPTTTPYSEWNLTDSPLYPPMSVLHRQPHAPHWTHSLLSRPAGARYELATTKLKPAVQGEAVVNLKQESLSPDPLPPLKTTTHTLPLSVDDQHRSSGSRGPLQPTPSQRSPTELDEIPLNSSPPSILGFPGSHTQYSAPDERRSRVTLQAGPSVSAPPSPPGFPPGPRDKELSVISGYSTSGQTFSSAMLWEGNSVRGIEMTLPDESQASAPHPGASTLQPTSTVNQRPVPSRHPHPESIGRGEILVRLRGFSRASSMRRLSRIPLGPRQMLDRPESQRRRAPQPPSL